MTLEEYREKIRPIIEASIEEKHYEGTEDILKEVQSDYEEWDKNKSDGEWKVRYEELKKKYVDRFLNGSSDEIEEREEREKRRERKKKEKEDGRDEEEIEIEDLFTEKKEEK